MTESAYDRLRRERCEFCRAEVPMCCDPHPHTGTQYHRDPSWSNPQTWRPHQACTAPTLAQAFEEQAARIAELEKERDEALGWARHCKFIVEASDARVLSDEARMRWLCQAGHEEIEGLLPHSTYGDVDAWRKWIDALIERAAEGTK